MRRLDTTVNTGPRHITKGVSGTEQTPKELGDLVRKGNRKTEKANCQAK